MQTNLPQHPCANKCSEFTEEQCGHCLISESDFIAGDTVVYQNHVDCDDLQEIEAFQPTEYYWLENGQLVHRDDIRSATPAELKAKRRLDQPIALFVSG